MADLIVKLLNGDLISIPFDSPEQELMTVFVKIWETCGLGINTWVFEKEKNDEKNEEMDNRNDKIVISEFHSQYDFINKKDLFVKEKDDPFVRKREGAFRKIDLRRFGRCNVFSSTSNASRSSNAVRRQLAVYYDPKTNRVMCVDLRDFSFHKQIEELGFDLYDRRLRNEDFQYIDFDSFEMMAGASKMFRAGSRVFESTGDKIDIYISRRLMGYEPGFMCKVKRDGFSVNPLKHLLVSQKVECSKQNKISK